MSENADTADAGEGSFRVTDKMLTLIKILLSQLTNFGTEKRAEMMILGADLMVQFKGQKYSD